MNENAAFTFHHHWIKYWKSLATVSLLLLLTPVGMVAWLPLGMGCLMLAAVLATNVYLSWTWNTFSFTDDQRLVRSRGVFRCTRDVISLFGVITPYQIPGLGEMLDVGNIHLSVLGPDIHIEHIGHFSAFYQQLLYSTGQQQVRESPVVQLVFQVPPAP